MSENWFLLLNVVVSEFIGNSNIHKYIMKLSEATQFLRSKGYLVRLK